MIEAPADWFRTFFGDGFWAVAEIEYSTERTRAEAAYLAEVLRELAPGRAVADLGCGKGRHAALLARSGFDVIGVDLSDELLEAARAAASREPGAGSARFVAHDLLSAHPWPFDRVDAAISIQAFGWGSDADQRRFLARARRRLGRRGVLVLDVSNAAAILRHFVPQVAVETPAGVVELDRAFDVASGRNLGTLALRNGSAVERRAHAIRLYHCDQVEELLREAGFDVLRRDADFEAGAEVGLDTRYVQFVARPRRAPPRSLAVWSYADEPAAAAVDLRWSPDEERFLQPRPRAVWRRFLASRSAFAHAADYGVDDPHGERRAAAAVARFHGVRFPPGTVSFAAGISALLQQLAGLADGGDVLVGPVAHPDLGAWARGRGCAVRTWRDDLAEEVGRTRPALVVCDRPGSDGSCASADKLRRLFAAAADAGTLVVVDEAYGSYLAPAESAAPLTLEAPNAIVLRSFSKGYCAGGLRVGYAVASEAVAEAVRELVGVLGVSSLPLAFAVELLAAGDVCAPLRDRLRSAKPAALEALRALGIDASPTHPALPWVLVHDPEGRAEARLGERGILGKRLVAPLDGEPSPELKIAVPLNARRLAALERAVTA